MKYFSIILTCLVAILFSACSKDSENNSDIEVYLQDSPADYEKIKVEVKGVSIYSQTAGEWVTLTVNNGIFDLLTLDGNNQAFLGKVKVAGGNISQMQLIIGNQNSVTVAGITHPLILDAADLDKLKVKFDHNINSGWSYKLTIDFKAAESIDSSGNVYKLKASLKVTLKAI